MRFKSRFDGGCRKLGRISRLPPDHLRLRGGDLGNRAAQKHDPVFVIHR